MVGVYQNAKRGCEDLCMRRELGALGKVDLPVILKSDSNYYYYFVSVRFGPFKDDIVTLYVEIFCVLHLGLRVIGLSPFESEKRAWRLFRWKWNAFLYEKKLKKEEKERL